ncbi:MAG: FAD-dependent monooxygenase [Gammaproteobacteria bacterium]|nr:FAD-dependent monooxygenase [Gammaproteobacteria bacterium]
MSVLIVGGGIGGLAAAVALRRVGISVRVFERAPEIREVGASISVFSNAVKALRAMGLEDQVLSLAPELTKISFLSPSGRTLTSTDVQAISQASGAASIMVHRADLQQTLFEALDPEQVSTGKECVGVTQDETGVTVHFADQTQVRGEVAVGADGIRSTVASTLFGEGKLRYAGYHCYRAIAKTPNTPMNEGIWILLPGIQFVLLPEVRPGETYWCFCQNSPPGRAATYTKRDHAAHLRSIAGQLPDILGEMVAGTDMDSVFVDDVYDRRPRRHWGRGRVSLLGDAAHPTTPTFGQGACAAIEDAVVLADNLRQAKDPVTGLRSYEIARRRTAKMTRLSWRTGKILQYEHPALVWWRTVSMSMRASQWNANRILRWFVRHNVPTLDHATADFNSTSEL